MKVYICYDCYYDECDIWRTVVKVYDDEMKALLWQEEVKATRNEWREYETHTVE